MPPDQYPRAPRCLVCGRYGTLRPDAWMNKRQSLTCFCQGYHFPHRLGSGACYRRVFDREQFEERAAIIEFDGAAPREEAEELAIVEQHERHHRRSL